MVLVFILQMLMMNWYGTSERSKAPYRPGMHMIVLFPHHRDRFQLLLTRIYGTIPCQNKISCFIWLAVRLRILTWENLQKKGKQGPGICVLCKADEETVEHLFTKCSVWKLVAEQICDHLNLHAFSAHFSLVDMLLDWLGKISLSSTLHLLPFHIMWIVWKVRNKVIFEDEKKWVDI